MPQTMPGCDLARDWIDLHRLPENTARRIANDGTSMADALADLPPDALVVFEATPGCDGPLVAALSARGVALARANPRRARAFAGAIGVLAETDRVDARVLARMGARLALQPAAPRSPARTRLAGFLRRRKRLVEMRKAEKSRRHDAGAPDIRAEIARMIAILDRRIARLDRAVAEAIAADTALRGQAEPMRDSPSHPAPASSPPSSPRRAARRAAGAGASRPKAHRLPRRARAAGPRKRDLARRTAHLGLAAARRRGAPPPALYASRRIPAAHRLASEDARREKSTENRPHRRREADARHPQRDAQGKTAHQAPNTVDPARGG